ncbi:hypothetical protein [Streptomyces sp. TRM75561]|uniref:hypothetical protein n=1 Tax=Streptomyces sp. TRM75561 TaxID=2975269 RepID=UPI00244C3CFE|nr:hypothetical protein [Streptomyces sp. TRM75561]MDH3037359.1 hypothetical protein [Streptomyces sp. TRM75561]
MAEKPSEEPRPESAAPPGDAWEQFLRDSEAGVPASAPKEPSARARMVTERLRALDEAHAAAAGRKGRRFGWSRPVAPARPEGWRTGPAWREMDGRASRRRTVWSVVGVLTAAALAVVAVNPSAALSWLPGGLGGGGADASGASASRVDASGVEASGVEASPLAPETARPTGAPGEAEGIPTRERPFTGSPAARWEAGADAIRLPRAKAVNGVPAARIEEALRGTKEFLAAANLDPAVLKGGEPVKALALVDPLEADYLADLRAAVRRPTEDNDPVSAFTRFDPEKVDLVGAVRVRGRMTVAPDTAAEGRALITADYTFVYGMARVGGDETTRVIVRRVLQVDAADPSRYQGTEGRLWIRDLASEIGNDDCREGDGLINPSFFSDLLSASPQAGGTRDPYDRSTSVSREDECGVVSRT